MADNASQNKSLHRVAFKGEGGEYFSIWLVNLLLTIITLVFILPGLPYVVAVTFMAILS